MYSRLSLLAAWSEERLQHYITTTKMHQVIPDFICKVLECPSPVQAVALLFSSSVCLLNVETGEVAEYWVVYTQPRFA